MYYIYRLVNKYNGHDYIGKRCCPNGLTPLEDPYMGSGSELSNVIKKYGDDSLVKTILVENIESELEINELEKRYIKEYKNSGLAYYNISEGGTGGNTYKYMSPERKSEISKKASKKSMEMLNSRSDEEKQSSINKMLLTKSLWSDDKKEAFRKSQSEKRHNAWLNKSIEEIQESVNKYKITCSSRSIDEKKRISRILSNARQDYEKRITDEDKENRRLKSSREYKIQFPDGHIEKIFGLIQFCKVEFGDKWKSANNGFYSRNRTYKKYKVID